MNEQWKNLTIAALGKKIGQMRSSPSSSVQQRGKELEDLLIGTMEKPDISVMDLMVMVKMADS